MVLPVLVAHDTEEIRLEPGKCPNNRPHNRGGSVMDLHSAEAAQPHVLPKVSFPLHC